MTTCTAETASLKPCQAQAIRGSTLCFTHDPAQDAARAKARKRGGERRRAAHGADPATLPAQPRSVTEVLAILDFALAEVIPMENSIQRARVLIALSDQYCKVLELRDLEVRRLADEKASAVEKEKFAAKFPELFA